MSWITLTLDQWAALTLEQWAVLPLDGGMVRSLGKPQGTRGITEMYNIPQNSTDTPLLFTLVDEIDHVTPETGKTPSVAISKNGGAFSAPNGTVSEIGNGIYKLTPTTYDTDTTGPLELHATATGCDPADYVFTVGTDVWGQAMGVYPGTTAGGYLSNIKSQVSLIPTSLRPTTPTFPPSPPATTITIVRGDDYSTEGRWLSFVSEAWGDLTDCTVVMTARNTSDTLLFEAEGDVITAGSGAQEVRFSLTHEDTDSLAIGTHKFDIQATGTEGEPPTGLIETLIIGNLVVLKDYTRPITTP